MKLRLVVAAIACLSLALGSTACCSTRRQNRNACRRQSRDGNFLPYRIDLREPKGEPDSLSGTIHAAGRDVPLLRLRPRR